MDTALLCRELVEEFQVQDFNLFAGAYKLKLFKALQLVTLWPFSKNDFRNVASHIFRKWIESVARYRRCSPILS